MWTKLDDGVADHPKMRRAAGLLGGTRYYPQAWLCWTKGLLWANRHLTDGFVSLDAVDSFVGYGLIKPRNVAAALVRAGLWEAVDDGYRIHDHLDYNPTREEVMALRDERREAGRRGGIAKAKRLATAIALARQDAKQPPGNDPSKPVAKLCPDPDPDPDPEVQPASSIFSDVPQQQAVHDARSSTKNNGRPSRAASGADRAELLTLFEDFWEHYPKKHHKQAALTAWLKLHPSAILAAHIRNAIIEQKTWPTGLGDTREHMRFVPNPATWLNAGGWDDEAPIADSAPPRVGDRVRCEPCARCGYPDPAHHSQTMCNQLYLEQQRQQGES